MKNFIAVIPSFVIIMAITLNAQTSNNGWSAKEMDSLSLFYLGNQQVSYQKSSDFVDNPNYKLQYTPWDTRSIIMQYGIKARHGIYIFQKVTPAKKDTIK